MEKAMIQRDVVLTTLMEQRELIQTEFGVTRLGIFGSVVRNEANALSDLDVVVEMAPDLFTMVHLKEYLQEMFNVPVDLVRYRQDMNTSLKERIDQEAVYV